ncbi:hypothetical protein Scep_016764 [Stephania cephalantha]|uniref:Uncharacterized protein n=1 Tax=Stephania cephalantha TaxID=152367 RepID=A0AAP0INB5_9MAGN
MSRDTCAQKIRGHGSIFIHTTFKSNFDHLSHSHRFGKLEKKEKSCWSVQGEEEDQQVWLRGISGVGEEEDQVIKLVHIRKRVRERGQY